MNDLSPAAVSAGAAVAATTVTGLPSSMPTGTKDQDDADVEFSSSVAEGEDRTVAIEKQSFIKTLWDFSRPHTMIGTAVAIPSIGLFAAPAGE